MWVIRQIVNVVQSAAPDRYDLGAMLFAKLGLDLSLNLQLFIRSLGLVDNRCFEVGNDEALEELFWFGIGDEKSTAERSKTGSELLDSLDLEARPPNPTLAHPILLRSLRVEPRVKAVHRHDLFVLAGALGGSPVQHWIVMNAKIVAHPEDDSVHFLRR